MSSLLQDLRFGLRMLLRHPGFTAVAVVSLALAMVVNTTFFALLDGALLRPLPFAEPERLVRLFSASTQGSRGGFVPEEYDLIREKARCLKSLAAVEHGGGVVRDGDFFEMVLADQVSRNYLAVLGVRPMLGCGFDEVAGSGGDVIMIGYDLWTRAFHRDPNVVGRTTEFQNRVVTVIGVAPVGFGGTERCLTSEVWYPVGAGPESGQFTGKRSVCLLGRLADGRDLEQAQAEMDSLVGGMAGPDSPSESLSAIALERETDYLLPGGGRKGALYALLALPAIVLLLACANVSAVVLAKSEARRQEIATRLALGGRRWQIVRQLLIEGLLLSLLAGACTLLLTRWLTDLLPAIMPALPIHIDLGLRVDLRVAGYTFFLSLLATVLFAVGPALKAARVDLLSQMKGEAPGGGRCRMRLLGRRIVVVGQLTVSFLFVALALSVVESFRRGLTSDLGFTRKPLLLVILSPDYFGYQEEPARAFLGELMKRVEGLPGVRQVTLARRAPLSLFSEGATEEVSVPGDHSPAGGEGHRLKYNILVPGFLEFMGTKLRRGRDFGPQDDPSSRRVVLVSETAAARFWPGRDAIGQQLRIGEENAEPAEVVGVVADVKQTRIGEAPEPYLYFPFAQRYNEEMTVLIETEGRPQELAAAVREEIRRLDERVFPVITTMHDSIGMSLLPERVASTLLGTFGLLALALGVAGLFGVVSFTTHRRIREFGIRIAMGATRRDIVRLVLNQGLRLAAVGTSLGLALSLIASRAVSTEFFFGQSGVFVASHLLALVAVLGTTLVASYLPARRAAQVDPMASLRHE